MCFQPLGEPKNVEKRSLSADEMRKTRKSACCRSTKRKKREKVLIVGRRNAENAEKCSSSADETRKTRESARRRLTKRRKRRKTVFRRGTMGRKREKLRFVGVQSIKKRRKQHFGHGRN